MGCFNRKIPLDGVSVEVEEEDDDEDDDNDELEADPGAGTGGGREGEAVVEAPVRVAVDVDGGSEGWPSVVDFPFLIVPAVVLLVVGSEEEREFDCDGEGAVVNSIFTTRSNKCPLFAAKAGSFNVFTYCCKSSHSRLASTSCRHFRIRLCSIVLEEVVGVVESSGAGNVIAVVVVVVPVRRWPWWGSPAFFSLSILEVVVLAEGRWGEEGSTCDGG